MQKPVAPNLKAMIKDAMAVPAGTVGEEQALGERAAPDEQLS
ncbi:MAG: hypothetical protein JWQ94_366 [Tardiphaga sp.]|nr:hypothetical protein [Tardiphaga sp.]